MIRYLVFFAVVILGIALVASQFGGGAQRPAAVAVNAGPSAVDLCVRRGIAYFKEIGSFPDLSDGRDAATVAVERCRRTTTAFP